MGAEAHYDAIVIGSGFGGSVAAYRLAEAGRRVCLLERGKAYPPGSFPRRPRDVASNVWDPSAGAHGLYNVWSFRKIEALVSAGLGGGSLIYANVLLRKDERWFRQRRPDGSGTEDWPVTRAELEPHYDAVEAMLGAQRFPFGQPGYRHVTKTAAMREAGEHLGLEFGLPKLAVSFANDGQAPRPGEVLQPAWYPNLHGADRLTCRLCGECDLGCNDGAKNTLDHTYLSAAAFHGADIRTRAEVRTITPTGGGYEVGYVEHRPEHEGEPTRTDRLPLLRITADRVVVAAGALGSTFLLLRNARNLPALGPALGTRFCGNGDLLTFAVRAGGRGEPRWLDPSLGPVITSYLRSADEFDDPAGEGPGYYIEDAGYPALVDWLLEGTTVSSTTARLARFLGRRLWARLRNDPRSDLSGELTRLLGDARLSAASLPLLGMGRDVPDGTMRLRGQFLDVDWRMNSSRPYFEALDATMARIAETWQAEFRRNPLWWLQRVITVHPLGGCPMGVDANRGVVDAHGESFGHPGLYVADGSVMPGPVGANPALTIAAFADRLCDRLLDSPGRSPVRAAPAPTPAATTTVTGLHFTEEMKGFVTPGADDFEAAARAGASAGRSLMFRLTITIDDVERFLHDPDLEATATGWVQCDLLGGRLPVERSWFNLFVETDDPARTHMRYRLHLRTGDGRPLTLTGFKVVADDPGFDVWRDTTRLYVRVLDGHVAPAEDEGATVRATGVITISVPDFLRQLTTFRARGPNRRAEAAALAAFGRLFLGQLWETYGGRAKVGAT